MAQPTSPSSSETARPLPRYERGKVGGQKNPRPRFQILDGGWLVVLIAVFAMTLVLSRPGQTTPLTIFFSALTILGCYLLGWRIAGRPCGVAAGLLAAAGPGFAAASTLGSAFTFLTVAALFAIVADSPIPACALAGLATVARPDGALLGLLLMAFISVRMPKKSLPSAGAFLGVTFVGWALRLALGHQPFPAPLFHAETWALAWTVAPASLFLLWFLVPFCADLTDSLRGPRWAAVVLWAIAYTAFASFVHFAGASDTACPMMPVVFVAIAGGLSRLLPALAGEKPGLRYVLATLAVLGILGIRAVQEQPKPQSTPKPAPSVAIPVVMPVPPVPVPFTHKAAPKVKKPKVKKPLTKPAVSLYTMQNGHLVKRSKWAIEWDAHHPPVSP